MSKETTAWLNNNVLIGFTDKRRHAWHYRMSAQGVEPNHYPGAVPIADVRRRLFSWSVVESQPTSTGQYKRADGTMDFFTVTDSDRKTILRPPEALGPDDKGGMLGVFKAGYQPHNYDEWLLDRVSLVLDDGLSIGSAGLLKAGAVAWVSVEVPDSFTTPEGVEFRPNLLATTSFDGSLATTYKRVVTNVVCDNTMAAGLAESGQTYRVKHSKYSDLKALEARDALQLVHTIAADFADQVAQLTATKVSDQEWSRFLAEIIPNERDGQEMTKRARTIAEKKRMEMTTLWTQDVRVAPWKNTAFGVLQAVNTHAHHLQTVRGAGRAERNMLRTVAGDFDTLDIATLDTLHAVLT